MAVQTATAEDLVEEVFLFGRALRNILGGADTSGLPPALLGVLHVLATVGQCRQMELASNLCVSQSSLSRQIADLVDAGFVERHADPEDGRVSLVRLSESGTELLRANRERRAERLRTLLGEWSEEEAHEAVTSLRRLKHTFMTPPVRRAVSDAVSQNQGRTHL
ncbi:DNA-binding MarR family transcriptional regulator [Rhodococcus sp. PvR044]|jgi:DNA-binding MarR family transcriptional regulator|uniref:MarR family winged helix-turn-helix transcriptional regulator n=1 Tax=Rhodococcus TaxID=1827 RepID=UPI000BC3C4FE|nr:MULTISPECIES: MarR family transcriptional regulator [Rhodococcus]MBP1158443.1 DNA-binding MarR family transcriptional regulator [Rhodococcus sp. PvR099]MCZ4553998.1 MarR family transcriptional regulator [Rhodococcus maanshanensis]PTR43869.1 MarR family transcriptional regulator [Rhodococcus sp. OK611]SNX90687.1 transcriptional regulator, MarR family [Rhodococcus sp. OK270]